LVRVCYGTGGGGNLARRSSKPVHKKSSVWLGQSQARRGWRLVGWPRRARFHCFVKQESGVASEDPSAHHELDVRCNPPQTEAKRGTHGTRASHAFRDLV
jgi:hypothetical protein